MWNQTSSSVKDVMLNGDEFNTKHFHIIQMQNTEKKGESKPSSRHRSLRLLLESLVVCQPSKSILAVRIFPWISKCLSVSLLFSDFVKNPSNPFEPVFLLPFISTIDCSSFYSFWELWMSIFLSTTCGTVVAAHNILAPHLVPHLRSVFINIKKHVSQ